MAKFQLKNRKDGDQAKAQRGTAISMVSGLKPNCHTI
nr:MAG TPA: hypothetical protein [Caudoviricetes sp.]